jgi:hypothetical protein
MNDENELGFKACGPSTPQSADPQYSRYTSKVVPPSCCVDTVWWRVFEPRQGREATRRASRQRTWRWRVRRSPCPSCPTTHPPYVPAQALLTILLEAC